MKDKRIILQGNSELYHAIRKHDLGTASKFLNTEYFNPNEQLTYLTSCPRSIVNFNHVMPCMLNSSYLAVAVASDNLPITESLIGLGANVDFEVRSNTSLTIKPIYLSAVNGNYIATKLLLEEGASLHPASNTKISPFTYSYLGYVTKHHNTGIDTINLLLDYGAGKTIDSFELLLSTMRFGHVEVLTAICERDSSIFDHFMLCISSKIIDTIGGCLSSLTAIIDEDM